jgi:hypothetical protein
MKSIFSKKCLFVVILFSLGSVIFGETLSRQIDRITIINNTNQDLVLFSGSVAAIPAESSVTINIDILLDYSSLEKDLDFSRCFLKKSKLYRLEKEQSFLQKSVTFAEALEISRLKATKYTFLSGYSCKTRLLQEPQQIVHKSLDGKLQILPMLMITKNNVQIFNLTYHIFEELMINSPINHYSTSHDPLYTNKRILAFPSTLFCA